MHSRNNEKMKILLLLFFLLGCGAGNLNVSIEKKPLTKGRFLLSTDETSISSYNVALIFNLYDIYPELNDLDISSASFDILADAIEHASRFEPYNVAILIKDSTCSAPIGYCRAFLIRKNI